MIKGFSVLIALIIFSSPAMAAQNADCYTTFYQTKNIKCVDALIGTVGKSADVWAKQPRSAPSAVVGFLAEIFSDYPKERKHILEQDVSLNVKSIYLTALVRAGLPEEGKVYADKAGWSEGFKGYLSTKVPTLAQIKPISNPADNDVLIGAYMASGNTHYIATLLGNYTSAKDDMARDAFRIALMQSKFGPRLMPPGRPNSMVSAVCNKYKCRENIIDMMRVMTLATGLWATQSLAKHDKGVKKALLEFFDKNPHLKQLFAAEQNAFGNYVTMLAAYAGVKDNPNINSSLAIYEELGSGEDALNAMKKK